MGFEAGERSQGGSAGAARADAGATAGKQTLNGAEVGAHDHPAEGEADAVAAKVVDKLHNGEQDKAGSDWASQRPRFERAFGADFSAVRVHIGGESDDHARDLSASAFAKGNEVHFRAGQFSPGTRDGDFLIAHELAHVVQQGAAAPAGGATIRRQIFDGIVERGGGAVRRKITLAGKAYKPTAVLLGKLDDVGKEHVTTLDANLHVFDFADEAALLREATVRQNIVKGMNTVNTPGACRYFHPNEAAWLDPAFWDKTGDFAFTVKDGVKASAAIARIFEKRPDKEQSKLECLSMTMAIEFKAQLDTLGAAQFDKNYPKGAGVVISNGQKGLPKADKDATTGAGASYKGVEDLQPGDWVYFKNHAEYLKKHPRGYWQGENAVYMGREGGKAAGERIFGGFGVKNEKESALKADLLREFNADPSDLDKADSRFDKGLANKKITIDEIPGVLVNPVTRPGPKATDVK